MSRKTIIGFSAGMMATGALQFAWREDWWSVLIFAAVSAFFVTCAETRNPTHDQ